MKVVRVFILGIVQGVFFRKFIKENADKLNIKGYAKNLENGNIEAFFEGSEEDIKKIIRLCKKGPNYAKIEEIKVIDEKPYNFKEFKIVYWIN